MIYSSLNRLPFIRPSPFRDGLYLKPVGLAASRPGKVSNDTEGEVSDDI
jgi:hypothetical protein